MLDEHLPVGRHRRCGPIALVRPLSVSWQVSPWFTQLGAPASFLLKAHLPRETFLTTEHRHCPISEPNTITRKPTAFWSCPLVPPEPQQHRAVCPALGRYAFKMLVTSRLGLYPAGKREPRNAIPPGTGRQGRPLPVQCCTLMLGTPEGTRKGLHVCRLTRQTTSSGSIPPWRRSLIQG